MWFYKSRSIPKRKDRCAISFLNFCKKDRIRIKTDVGLPNKEIRINKEKLFENQGIDTNSSLNFKFSGLDINIFQLPIIDRQDTTSIYIGIQDYKTVKDVLYIEKDNNPKYYVLLPYFKVDKKNLVEGKYINAHTKLSYHLGLFEKQISIQETDDNSIKKLETIKLIDTISLRNELTFNEFFVNYDKFRFGKIKFDYLLNRLFDVQAYNLKLPLTETIYYFDILNLENPKIGTIKISGDDFDNIYHGKLLFNKGRWILQLQLKNERYFIKDNCDGKYEKMGRVFYDYESRQYNKQTNPYFSFKLKLDQYTDIMFNQVEDLKHLSFSKSINQRLRCQFTPFNNLNLVYYHDDKDWHYLYEYCLLAKNKDTYIATKLNPKTINNKYKIDDQYNNIYHCYLYYLDSYKRVPYIQIWEDNNTNQTYGCILNMMGKWGVFDKEIIEERT